MTEQIARKFDFSRKLLLSSVAVLAIAAPILLGLIHVTHVRAQSSQDITGTWQGTLHAGKDLRIVYKITKADGGVYKAVVYSIDQGGMAIPAEQNEVMATAAFILMSAKDWGEFERRSIRSKEISALLGKPSIDIDAA